MSQCRADALLEVAIAKEASTSLEDEAVAIVPVVKHPGQQITEGDRWIPFVRALTAAWARS
jgi:hypothetical protein